MALIGKRHKPIKYRHPNLDSYILHPGSIVNIGITKEQGFHKGGGWQFELVSGFAQFYEREKDPKRVRF
jgi:hypothetical protein